MAELLVRNIDNVNDDPEVDARGSYKRGMVVVAMPDKHEWGAAEGLPNFVVVKIPEIPVEKVQDYLQSQKLASVVVARRLWQIDVSLLDQALKDALDQKGEIIVKATDAYKDTFDTTWTDLKAAVINKETGLPETKELDAGIIVVPVDPAPEETKKP